MRRAFGLLTVLSASLAWGQGGSAVNADDRLHIPNRAPESLFRGRQGSQQTEIHYDKASGLVTLKLLVQDPKGHFIPGIRRENFVVYEDGVRRNNVSVDIEHAPVTLGLLVEYGGRHLGVNRDLAMEVSRAARQLLDALGRQDKVAVWAYGDTVMQLAGFSEDIHAAQEMFFDLHPPGVSETNLYDAIIYTLDRMRTVNGRKAVILLSSGLDTFSKATAEDAVAAAGIAGTPIYAISLAASVQQSISLQSWPANPFARVNWNDLQSKLLNIAQASGGRLYTPDDTLDLTGIWADIMENLRVRYVITYKPLGASDPAKPRTVRVELVNPKTGKPLEIVDAEGRPVHASVILESSYTPGR